MVIGSVASSFSGTLSNIVLASILFLGNNLEIGL